MKTVALRFSDKFAPDIGTILAHNEVIDQYGYVWYGKLGSIVSQKVIDDILKNEDPMILLIHSGKADRYWAHIEKIQHDVPNKNQIPGYYRDNAGIFKTWFKVVRFDNAPSDVLSRCIVVSSNRPLTEVSKSSMSPYFIINVEDKT